MDSWALQPRTNSDNNSKKCVTCMFVPQTKYLMPRTLYTLDLGLILYHIPVNTIVKIENNCFLKSICQKSVKSDPIAIFIQYIQYQVHSISD